MPVFPRRVLTSRTVQARAENSSEAAALPNGEKALTPIIAGTISGTCIGVAWLVALIVILVKRHQRKRRYKELGQTEAEVEASRAAEFIVPPDPAVLQGSHLPGERLVVVHKRRWWKVRGRRRARSVSADGRKEKGKEKEVLPTRPRAMSAHGVRPETQAGTIIQDGIHNVPVEEEDRPFQPPFHRLSTIVSVAVSQRSSPRLPPDADAATRGNVKDVDFAKSKDTSAEAHKYPPSRSPHY